MIDASGARIRLHLWLETEEGVAFGMGRLQLLERIESLGSLRAAATSLGMSYRAAWGKLKTTERIMGRPLVEKPGGDKSGFMLSPYGRSLAEGYRRWFAALESQAAVLAGEYLPCVTRPFADTPQPGAVEDQPPKECLTWQVKVGAEPCRQPRRAANRRQKH